MKLRLFSAVFALSFGFVLLPVSNAQQQPPGVPDAIGNLVSQTPTHTAVEFDHEMLQGLMGNQPLAGLNSITFESYHYHEPAFYTPEAMSALIVAYDRAGWHHLVNANASPRDSASPHQALTDMWLHFQGTSVDGCTVLIRASKQMNVIEVSGVFRPLDIVKLSGHFGIPKVDPGAVMVPAPPGR